MAACDLSVELDDPQPAYVGGQSIRGSVVVRCSQDVNCKGLDIATAWRTHGRGNVDSGVGGSVIVYSGLWEAGREYRYPFELPLAIWPPTYYGTLLNVSHSVDARARLPWKMDPKASAELTVVCDQSVGDLKPARQQSSSWVTKIVLGIVATVVVPLLLFGLAIFVIPVLLIAGVVWFIRSYLPKRLTGPVEFRLETERPVAGEPVRGVLELRPPKRLKVNGITARVRCQEVCVSGSGSNRTTHRHTAFEQTAVVIDQYRELPAGEAQRFEIEIPLPAASPPSIELSDNKIEWNIEWRIDLPRWPDLTKKQPLRVRSIPGSGATAGAFAASGVLPSDMPYASSANSQWFDTTLEQLRQNAEDPEAVRMITEAVIADRFELVLQLEEEADHELATAARELPDGHWVEANDVARDETVLIYFPAAIARPPVPSRWRGSVEIVGYDAELDAVLVQAVVA